MSGFDYNTEHTLTISKCGLERSFEAAHKALQNALDEHYDGLRRVANEYDIDADHFVNFWHIRFPLTPVAYAYKWAEDMSDPKRHNTFTVEDLTAMVAAGFDYDWIERKLIKMGV